MKEFVLTNMILLLCILIMTSIFMLSDLCVLPSIWFSEKHKLCSSPSMRVHLKKSQYMPHNHVKYLYHSH